MENKKVSELEIDVFKKHRQKLMICMSKIFSCILVFLYFLEMLALFSMAYVCSFVQIQIFIRVTL